MNTSFKNWTAEEKTAFAASKNTEFLERNPGEVLEYFLKEFPGKAALSSSLSYEDQVLTDMMVGIRKDARIFTLDTGRQFPETYELIDRTNMQYGISIEVFFPDFRKVQEMVREHGINLFYDSVELRHKCCEIRKIEPLKRALQGVDVWISGLRRSQSVTRAGMQMVEYDTADDVLKLNPLILWSEEQVKQYVKENGVPYNRLHEKGFPSIGCQPCTRAVAPGDDIRSGRWWWEDPDHRECGLHVRH
ncbi:MAG: phosphoadenylyl-sulfate reductase [Candidatus Cryptobacteroides sp.]|nr:phosphoadenylyl-sulfate reductase [Candidatus Cryptobacteroides sp.]